MSYRSVMLPFLSLLFAKSAYSQYPEDSRPLFFAPNYTQVSFNQELNLFRWLYSINIDKLLSDRVNIRLHETFQTNLQSISGSDLWKDQHDFAFDLDYRIDSRFSIQPEITSHVLSDPLAGFDNNLIFHSGTARVVYRPDYHVSIAPQASVKWQTQLEQSDQGLGLGIDAEVNDLNLGGYGNDIRVFGQRDVFPERKNGDIQARYRIQREFYNNTADTLAVFYNRFRRDSFAASDSGIFVRNLTQAIGGVENRLRYGLTTGTTLYVRTLFASSLFNVKNLQGSLSTISKDDATFESNHQFRIEVIRPTWSSRVAWTYSSRSLDDRRPPDDFDDPFNNPYPSLGFDTEEVFVSLSATGGFRISASDSLGIWGSVSKFRFETTQASASNDHDQIKWQSTFSHRHDWGPGLRLIWRASAFLNHFVFVSGQFSAGNNWERVFQIVPQLQYSQSNGFSFVQGFTVRAKYQTFDFEDPDSGGRNNVNRQFLLWNLTKVPLTTRSRLDLSFNLELSEQGQLFYESWRQRLALSWRNQEVQVLYRYRFGRALNVAFGGSLFHQIRWNHRPSLQGGLEKTVRDKHTNVGPVLRITYVPHQALQFYLYANVLAARPSEGATRYNNYFDVNLNWFF